MIDKLMEAVLKKHGPFTVLIDKMGRFELRQEGSQKVFAAFSLGSCLIKMLGEEKK